jgi:penicillin-binding protein 1A
LCLALVLVVALSGVVYVIWQVPLPAEDPPLLETSFVCASNVSTDCNADNAIAQLSADVDRVSVDYEQIPPIVVLAVVAVEDREFFDHSGVNPVAVGRALWADLRNEGLQQGGSTITQQYVKNTYLSDDRTLERKVREAVLAVKLERELAKQEIMERYLNTIYWGRGAYGIQAAARTYFGKDAEDLGLQEAAYLAGIIRAPEAADAQRADDDPLASEQREAATIRRKAALDAMVGEGYIEPEARDAVDGGGWDYVLERSDTTSYGEVARPELGTEYFVDYVRHWLVASGRFTDAELWGGGLRVYTTIDFEAQEAAVDAVESTLGRDDDPAASLVAIDEDGYVRAMVGGADHDESQVNLAVGVEGGGSGRQPGSSFKPIVLAEALSQGLPLETTYESPAKITIPEADAGNDWTVANYADAGLGTLNLVQATKVSSNTAYAQLIEETGAEPVAALGHRMGITGDLPQVPSLTLGTGSVSVLDMAAAFSTLANDGEKVGPWVVSRVTDAQGKILWEAPAEREQALDPEVAQAVSWVLHQVVEDGTGKAAKFDQPAAGKTGTTEEYRDAWFVGYTCHLTAAVWVGYPGTETRYMTNVHSIEVAGGTFPARIWRSFMVEATRGDEPCSYDRPPTVSASLERRTNDTTGSTTPPSTSTTVSEESTTTAAPPSTAAPTTAPATTVAPSTTVPPPTSAPTTAPPSTTTTTTPG